MTYRGTDGPTRDSTEQRLIEEEQAAHDAYIAMRATSAVAVAERNDEQQQARERFRIARENLYAFWAAEAESGRK
jgi:hypothetical protein